MKHVFMVQLLSIVDVNMFFFYKVDNIRKVYVRVFSTVVKSSAEVSFYWSLRGKNTALALRR